MCEARGRVNIVAHYLKTYSLFFHGAPHAVLYTVTGHGFTGPFSVIDSFTGSE